MIHLTRIPNVFEPYRQERSSEAFRPGSHLSDVLPDGYELDEPNVAVWHNGARATSDAKVRRGDYIHFVAAPTGPAVFEIFMYLVAAFFVAKIGAAIVRSLMPDTPQSDAFGGSTYGYYGFQNSYRAEGDALPLVYGTMRVAPPCINQTVMGAVPWSGTSGKFIISRSETLNTMYAVSRGPIEGFGAAIGPVLNNSDYTDLIPNVNGLALSGTQFNGIDAASFLSMCEWRTGGSTQTPIAGLMGFLNSTEPGTHFPLNLEITSGLYNIGGGDFPAGAYDYDDRIAPDNNSITGQGGDDTQFVSQFLSAKADIASVQFLWGRGVYTADPDTGKPKSRTVLLRIQYWETDSSDTTPSGSQQVVITPPITFSASTPSPISIEAPLTLIDPDTYGPPVQYGYSRFQASNDPTESFLSLNNTSGLQLIRPGAADYDPQLKWSTSFWASGFNWGGNPVIHPFNWTYTYNDGAWGNDQWDYGNFFNVVDRPYNLRAEGVWCEIVCDETGAWGPYDQIYFRLFSAYSAGGTGTYGPGNPTVSWWISQALGDRSSFGTTGWSAQLESHFALSYDQSTYTGANGQGEATVRLWVNGQEVSIALGPSGDNFGGPLFGFGTQAGYLFGNSGTYNTAGAGLHVPMRFNTTTQQSGTTYTKFHMGKWRDSLNQVNEREMGVYAEFMLMDGLISAALPSQMYNQRNIYGQRTFSVGGLAEDDNFKDSLRVCTRLNTIMAGTTNIVENLAPKTIGAKTGATGALYASYPSQIGTYAGGPIWTTETGTPKRAYYHIEAFKEAPTIDGSGGVDLTTIDSVTTFITQLFSYPDVAVFAASIQATDQINSTEPTVTMIVHGRRVQVWDGVSEAAPQFTTEFSRNPAWIAMDLLTGIDYGMGGVFAPEGTYENIDLPSFYAWSQFCDEGTLDGYGDVTFFYMSIAQVLVDGEGTPFSYDYHLTVYVGLIDAADETYQTLPESWAIGKFVSISDVFVGQGLVPGWDTTDDAVGGKNNSSSMMEVKGIVMTTPATALNGFNGYAEVTFNWNRRDSEGNPVFPEDAPLTPTWDVTAAGSTTSDYLAKVGGYEARCRFDGVFDQKNKAGWDSILEVFQAGRGMPVKAANKLLATFDGPRDPVAFFGQGNIVEGSLGITYLSPTLNPNSIEIEILDADHNYEKRTVLVDHPDIQDPTQFGNLRKERISAKGTVRRSQATRDGILRLNRYNLIRRAITFEAGPDSVTVLPGDRILVSHDVPQYGYSGRLATDAVFINSHPAGNGLYAAWTREGGDCTVSNMGVLVDGVATPITGAGYGSNAAHAYAVPVVGQTTAGAQKASGYEAGPNWAQQFVAVGDGLYPYPGNPPTNAIAPLDQILSNTKKIAFSCYFKEPSTGASEYILLNFYRFCDDTETFVKVSHAARFQWSSGALTTDGFEGSGGVTSGVDNTGLGSGWYRATIVYDNAAVGGGGAAAIGDYIQLRAYFSYTDLSTAAPIQQFDTVASGGRGVQLLKYGDPLDVDSSATSWVKYTNGGTIGNSTSIAPPFYSADTGSSAGNNGYVVQMVTPSPGGGNGCVINQTITLPTGAATGTPAWAGKRLCLTMYARADASVSSHASAKLYVNLRDSISMESGNRLNGNGMEAVFVMADAASGWSVSSTTGWDSSSGGVFTGTVANMAASVAPIAHNTAPTNDAYWVQINISFDFTPASSAALTILAVGINNRSESGGVYYPNTADIWGIRVHGAGGTGSPATSDLVNPYYHRGALMWGPMYEPEYAGVGTTPGTFGVGATIQLDRDVTLTAGGSYEVAIRSSAETDVALGADAYEVVSVSTHEVPTGADVTKAARTDLSVSSPRKLTPATGDVYSFGSVAATVEDLAVTSIDLKPDSLVRTIKGVEYVEAIYDDTAFGTLGDLTVSDLPATGGSNSAMAGAGDDGRGSAISLRATPFPYRNQNGGVVPAVYVSWRTPFGSRMWKESRLWVSQLNDDNEESAPRFAATIPSHITEYRYDDPEFDAALRYRFRLQRVGLNGTQEPFTAAPFVDVRPVITPPLSPAPTVSVSTSGYRQMYDVAATGTMRPAALEGRVGGWLISLPGYIVDPDVDRTATEAIVLGATNSAGDTNTSIVTREKLASGKYGVANTTTPAAAVVFDDARTTTTIIGEDNYAVLGTVPVDLDVASNVLHWDSGSSATGPVYYAFVESDLTTAQRVVATAIIQGYQVRPETLADLNFTLGSEDGRRWSIEGPMDDDGTNATVKLEWRWTSGASLSSVEYRPFEAGEVYFRKCQFRLVWTRPTDSYDVKLQRFVVRLYTPPLFAPGDVDGGTF